MSSSTRGEADEATRGSAVRLAAEVASRLLVFATTLLLSRRLGASEFGSFGELSLYALLLAELGELGLQTLASRALVAETLTLGSLLRARLVSAALATLAALVLVPLAPAAAAFVTRLGPARLGAGQRSALDAPALALLIAWFLLSGWAEFFGVALRCRRRRRAEAALLLVLRASGLLFVAAALQGSGTLRGVALALACSPLPALALGAILLRRLPAPAAPDPGPGAVLRESAPLAIHSGLVLLSPRVEFLVLSALYGGGAVVGIFYVALLVYWFLGMVPTAIAAGAMPALTREALHDGSAVRRRTSATLALLSAAAGVGLALVAEPLVRLLFGPVYTPAAVPLRLLSAAVPALFLNALVVAALVAAGRARWLPWLTAGRVVLAFALACALVPRLGAPGAAAGLVIAEWTLLVVGGLAVRRAGFAVPLVAPLAWGFLACVPMALVVQLVGSSWPAAAARGVWLDGIALSAVVGLGALTWLATLVSASRLAPGRVRQLTGDVRYP